MEDGSISYGYDDDPVYYDYGYDDDPIDCCYNEEVYYSDEEESAHQIIPKRKSLLELAYEAEQFGVSKRGFEEMSDDEEGGAEELKPQRKSLEELAREAEQEKAIRAQETQQFRSQTQARKPQQSNAAPETPSWKQKTNKFATSVPAPSSQNSGQQTPSWKTRTQTSNDPKAASGGSCSKQAGGGLPQATPSWKKNGSPASSSTPSWKNKKDVSDPSSTNKPSGGGDSKKSATQSAPWKTNKASDAAQTAQVGGKQHEPNPPPWKKKIGTGASSVVSGAGSTSPSQQTPAWKTKSASPHVSAPEPKTSEASNKSSQTPPWKKNGAAPLGSKVANAPSTPGAGEAKKPEETAAPAVAPEPEQQIPAWKKKSAAPLGPKVANVPSTPGSGEADKTEEAAVAAPEPTPEPEQQIPAWKKKSAIPQVVADSAKTTVSKPATASGISRQTPPWKKNAGSTASLGANAPSGQDSGKAGSEKTTTTTPGWKKKGVSSQATAEPNPAPGQKTATASSKPSQSIPWKKKTASSPVVVGESTPSSQDNDEADKLGQTATTTHDEVKQVPAWKKKSGSSKATADKTTVPGPKTVTTSSESKQMPPWKKASTAPSASSGLSPDADGADTVEQTTTTTHSWKKKDSSSSSVKAGNGKYGVATPQWKTKSTEIPSPTNVVVAPNKSEDDPDPDPVANTDTLESSIHSNDKDEQNSIPEKKTNAWKKAAVSPSDSSNRLKKADSLPKWKVKPSSENTQSAAPWKQSGTSGPVASVNNVDRQAVATGGKSPPWKKKDIDSTSTGNSENVTSDKDADASIASGDADVQKDISTASTLLAPRDNSAGSKSQATPPWKRSNTKGQTKTTAPWKKDDEKTDDQANNDNAGQTAEDEATPSQSDVGSLMSKKANEPRQEWKKAGTASFLSQSNKTKNQPIPWKKNATASLKEESKEEKPSSTDSREVNGANDDSAHIGSDLGSAKPSSSWKKKNTPPRAPADLKLAAGQKEIDSGSDRQVPSWKKKNPNSSPVTSSNSHPEKKQTTPAWKKHDTATSEPTKGNGVAAGTPAWEKSMFALGKKDASAGLDETKYKGTDACEQSDATPNLANEEGEQLVPAPKLPPWKKQTSPKPQEPTVGTTAAVAGKPSQTVPWHKPSAGLTASSSNVAGKAERAKEMAAVPSWKIRDAGKLMNNQNVSPLRKVDTTTLGSVDKAEPSTSNNEVLSETPTQEEKQDETQAPPQKESGGSVSSGTATPRFGRQVKTPAWTKNATGSKTPSESPVNKNAPSTESKFGKIQPVPSWKTKESPAKSQASKVQSGKDNSVPKNQQAQKGLANPRKVQAGPSWMNRQSS